MTLLPPGPLSWDLYGPLVVLERSDYQALPRGFDDFLITVSQSRRYSTGGLDQPSARPLNSASSVACACRMASV